MHQVQCYILKLHTGITPACLLRFVMIAFPTLVKLLNSSNAHLIHFQKLLAIPKT
jgi:hypothetical protein